VSFVANFTGQLMKINNENSAQQNVFAKLREWSNKIRYYFVSEDDRSEVRNRWLYKNTGDISKIQRLVKSDWHNAYIAVNRRF